MLAVVTMWDLSHRHQLIVGNNTFSVTPLLPSSSLPSRWRSRSLRAGAASHPLWLHLHLCKPQQPVRPPPVCIPTAPSLCMSDVSTSLCSRMCEYVDHLHEHFTSPVVIRDAHYMPPKVQTLQIKESPYWNVCWWLQAPQSQMFTVHRIQDILVKCWSLRCSNTSTQEEMCGNAKVKNDDSVLFKLNLEHIHLYFYKKRNNIFVQYFTHSIKIIVWSHSHKWVLYYYHHYFEKVSHSHLHLDGGMRIVVTDLKVFCMEIINALHFPQDLQLRERPNLPLKLQVESHETECNWAQVLGNWNTETHTPHLSVTHLDFERFNVVSVDVSVSQRVDKVSRLQWHTHTHTQKILF